jgi:hypothetical protein
MLIHGPIQSPHQYSHATEAMDPRDPYNRIPETGFEPFMAVRRKQRLPDDAAKSW